MMSILTVVPAGAVVRLLLFTRKKVTESRAVPVVILLEGLNGPVVVLTARTLEILKSI